MFLNPDLKLGFMLPIIYLFGFATAITWTTAMQSFKDTPSFEFLPLWKTWIFHPMANKVNEPKKSLTISLILSIKLN